MQITELPVELLEAIFNHLSAASILRVALTCHALNPAAITCLYSTITIAPASAPSREYSPSPYRLAICLVNDRTLGTRVRHLTFTNISADATSALTPRRTLPILVRTTANANANVRTLSPLLTHLHRQPHITAPPLAPPDPTAPHPHLTRYARHCLAHGLKTGSAQSHALFPALTGLTPHLLTLDLVWTGVGPHAAATTPRALRCALPALQALTLRTAAAAQQRGARTHRGTFKDDAVALPAWAVRGALAGGHPALRRVEFWGAGWAEMEVRPYGDEEGWAEVREGGALRVLALRRCSMVPGRVAEVLGLVARNCRRPGGLERLVVELVHPATVEQAVMYRRKGVEVALGELGDALRCLLNEKSGCGEVNTALRELAVTLDFIVPPFGSASVRGGEVGSDGAKFGVSGVLGSLRCFEGLRQLHVSWVVLVGWSLRSLQKEVNTTRGYLGRVLPRYLRWLTITDEMGTWLRWEWKPQEVIEMVRNWFGTEEQVYLRRLVWRFSNMDPSEDGVWAWPDETRHEMEIICEEAGVMCDFDMRGAGR